MVMAAKTQSIVWMAEARKIQNMYLYVNELGKADYTPLPKCAMKFRTESGCMAYIQEFDLSKHFHPTAHCFE